MIINIQDDILKINALGILDRMLIDKTTKRNIMWATDAYSSFGAKYGRNEEILPEVITGLNAGIIKTRARKAMEQQSVRTRQHAEVFTPLWVCRKMNDYADEVWDKTKSWQDYVDSRRLEITCGEAPYLVSRYDVESGEMIPIAERIGILDRKLRAVNENTQNEAEWLNWVYRAFQSTYGYEFQGDNLLIARVNLLMTFEEYLLGRWQRKPTLAEYKKIANTIIWNIWQMDGLTGTVPYAEVENNSLQVSMAELFGWGIADEEENRQPCCRIYNWRGERSLEFLTLQRKEQKAMKFDFIIGNPPFNEEAPGTSTSDKPIYHLFMNEAFELSDKVELITPARFLFDAGATPTAWNKKMLSDNHFKVLFYEANTKNIFSSAEIPGGIVITYRDNNVDFGQIGTFTAYQELNLILKKTMPFLNSQGSLNVIIYTQNKFNLDILNASIPDLDRIDKRLESNIFKLNIFTEKPLYNDDLKIIGLFENKRVFRYVNRKFIDIDNSPNIDKYKIILSKSNGASGTLGIEPARLITMPFVGEPYLG